MNYNFFIISIICSELKLKSSFRSALFTLLSFIDSNNKAYITINTLINILNRKNLSDKLNKRRIQLELDRYASIQVERNIELFSYTITGMELEITFPIFSIINEINELAQQDAEFSTAPLVVLERITREMISSRMNPIIEKPKPAPTAEQLVVNLSTTANQTIKKINKMVESKEVGREIIKEQMLTFLDDLTKEINTIGEPRPVYVYTPSYLTLTDLDQTELREYTAWVKAVVKDIRNNSDVKFDNVFGKNTFANVKLRNVNGAFGLDPNFIPNLGELTALESLKTIELNH
ncbi:MAG: hypothetical protein WAQ98_16195 [Blastocatellia bacterium]